MEKPIRFIYKIFLMVLFSAALNLSLHAVEPTIPEYEQLTSTVLSEQTVQFIPFNTRESVSPPQYVYSFPVINLTPCDNTWAPYNSHKKSMELFYRFNLAFDQEYPFIVLIRKLRI